MKKILFILLILACFAAKGQGIYQQNTLFGVDFNRTNAKYGLGVPLDTNIIHAYRIYPHLALKNDTLWKWSPSLSQWLIQDASVGGLNNYTDSIYFTNNVLNLRRAGIGTVLTTLFDTSKWHTKLYYDGIYASIANYYTKGRIDSLFSGTVPISGYNKTNWDNSYASWSAAQALGGWALQSALVDSATILRALIGSGGGSGTINPGVLDDIPTYTGTGTTIGPTSGFKWNSTDKRLEFDNSISYAGLVFKQSGTTYGSLLIEPTVLELGTNSASTALRLQSNNVGGINILDGITSIVSGFAYSGVNVVTNGLAHTITRQQHTTIINPATTTASQTITLPSNPSSGHEVRIFFGGTITSGAVVTSLTVSPNTGHTIVQSSAPTTANVGDALIYQFRSATNQWYRISTGDGGSGTVSSGLANKFAYYPSNGTTVESFPDLVWLPGSSTLQLSGNMLLGGTITMANQTTPSTPASGSTSLYPKTDGWYELLSNGTERKLYGGEATPTLQQVLTAGNTTSLNIVTTGHINQGSSSHVIDIGDVENANGGSKFSVGGNSNSAFLQGNLTLVNGSQLKLDAATSGLLTVTAPESVTSWTLTLPSNDGTANQVLTTDGFGNTSWTTPSSSSGSGLNFYNSDSTLSSNRVVYGQNNTRSLSFDSLNTFNVYRNAIDRIYMNSISSGIFSPDGVASAQVSNQVAQLNYNNTTTLEVNDSVKFTNPSGKYTFSHLPTKTPVSTDSALIADSLGRIHKSGYVSPSQFDELNTTSRTDSSVVIWDSTNNEYTHIPKSSFATSGGSGEMNRFDSIQKLSSIADIETATGNIAQVNKRVYHWYDSSGSRIVKRLAEDSSFTFSPPEGELMLDLYPDAGAAYSFFKLRNDYSGSCIKVRRTDNTEQDIGFDGSNYLDTAALKTFVGSGDGRIVTWYDQSGNSRDAVQNVTPTQGQPFIVTSGVIDRANGLVAARFDGVQMYLELPTGFLYNATSLSYFQVAAITDPGSFHAGVFGPTASSSTGLQVLQVSVASRPTYFSFNAGGARNDNAGSGYQLWNDATQSITTILGNSSATAAFKNNSTVTLTNSAAMPALDYNGVYAIGQYSGLPMLGKMQELVIYDTDQTSNRSAINSNINSRYATY
jgi:hypothetical protein